MNRPLLWGDGSGLDRSSALRSLLIRHNTGIDRARCRVGGRHNAVACPPSGAMLLTCIHKAQPLAHDRFSAAVTGREYLLNFCRLTQIEPTRACPRHEIRFPFTYSYMDDPETALRVAAEIARHAAAGTSELFLDQRPCIQVDLCAESVSSALALHAQYAKIGIDGEYPESREARQRVESFGTPAVIDGYSPTPDEEQVLIRLRRFVPDGENPVAFEERLSRNADELTERIDHLYARHRLTSDLAGSLSEFLGEALVNAAEHGDGDLWFAASKQRLSEDAVRCQIVVFNFGDTMHESLERMAPDCELRRECERMVDHHRQSGYFNETWTPENLMVLAALQHGITRFGGEGDRGSGTLRMIRFFEHLCQTSAASSAPRMCIVSGHTYILLDGRYKLHRSTGVTRGGKYDIAFNVPNDLQRPPNPASVRNLRGVFPGTLITTAFTLEKSHFSELRRDDVAPDDGEGVNRLVEIR